MTTYDPAAIAPYSQEMEEATLGSILINPDVLADVIFLRPEDFFILRHQYIMEAVMRLKGRSETVDILTVREELRAQNRLNDIGGSGYLTQLTLNVGTSSNAEVYGRIVHRAAIRRRMLTAADEIRGLAMDESISLEVAMRGFSAQYASIVSAESANDDPKSLREVMNEFWDHLEQMSSADPGVTGLATGLTDWDALLDGLQPESFNILAGRPGMGKTAVLMTIALNVARAGGSVYVWSGEMSERQLSIRVSSGETGIVSRKLRRGIRADGMDQSEWGRFVSAAGRLGNLNIILDTKPGLNPIQLETRINREAMRRGLAFDLIIVDYIGLMTPVGKFSGDNKTAEIANISFNLKQMATRICPILAAAQLNRAVENRSDKRPVPSDLRDSGSLEQDSDTITFLYRDAVYNPATEFPSLMEMIVAKNRHGECGIVNVHWEGKLTRITDARTQTIDLRGL